MTRREVRTFIETGVNAMVPVIEFHEGTIFNFASSKATYPSCLLLLESVASTEDQSAPSDSWSIELILSLQDKLDSLPKQYEDLVDRCDEVAQKLVYKYRNIVSGFKLTTMEDTLRERFIKSPLYGPDCLTGVKLSFSLKGPDQTNVC